MSGQIQCLNVVPTETMLGIMKVCLISATRVHALLKKKKDALTGWFRQILKKIASKKESMGEIMKTSSFAQTEAKYISRENSTLSSRISKMHLLKFDQSRKMLLV